MLIERQMRHLNHNALCAIAIDHTGEDPRRCDLVEICVVLLDNFIRPSKKLMPFYNQIAPFRPDTVDFKTASISRDKIYAAIQHGLEPSLAADRFEEWFGRLNLPERKKIVPLTYNWPVIREYLHTWLGTANFNYIFAEEYRDIMGVTYYINDCRNQVQKTIPYPRPEHLAYLCAQHGLEMRLSNDVMLRCQQMIKLYAQLLGIKHAGTELDIPQLPDNFSVPNSTIGT